MVAVLKERHRTFTVEEYLNIERAADYKSEYYRGRIYAMAGSSPAHSRIAMNAGGELRERLKGSGCGVYSNDLRVRTSTEGLFAYPDITVVCGELQFHDGRKDVAVNPIMIVEVLSPSTEDFDRGEKWREYQTIDSLMHYLLVAQDRPHVEHHAKMSGNHWVVTTFTSLEESVGLESIHCVLPLSEIYDGVDFSQAESAGETSQ